MSELILACRVCGLDFGFPQEAELHECPACGTQHSRPRARGSALVSLKRANYQRAACDFVNAEQDYRRVLFDHPDEHEALWGLVLCKYGVEYVEDEKTHVRRPVVHFLRRKPITEDADFRLAVARAPEDVRASYIADAEYISRIQQGVMAAESSSRPCDVFLCYKASLPGGQKEKTRDFGYARDLYFRLSMENYNVFFAHESLANVAGANYEAQIFYALQSAKVMLVVCTDAAYLQTPWVHSEWSRYLERVDAKQPCRLVPLLYDGCSPYSLPDPFITRSLQGLRMGELTSLDNLRSVLNEQLGARPVEQGVPVQDPHGQDSHRALLRINMALEDGDWTKAEALSQELIDEAPDLHQSHLSLLLARRRYTAADSLRSCTEPFEKDVLWKRALQFADPQTRDRLAGILNDSLARRRRLKNEEELHRLLQAGEWEKAQPVADALAADQASTCPALLGQLLLKHRLHRQDELAACMTPFEEDALWQPLLQSADASGRKALQGFLEHSQLLRSRRQNAATLHGLLEAENWQEALALSESLVQSDPGCSEYLLQHLMASKRIPTMSALAVFPDRFENAPQWKKLLSLAAPEEKARLESLATQHGKFLREETERRAAQAAEKKLLAKRQAEQKARELAAEEARLKKQHEEEAAARLAAAKGRVFFTRSREWPFDGPVLQLYELASNRFLGELPANSSLEIRIPDDCTLEVRSNSQIVLFTVHAFANRIIRVDVKWPFLGSARFNVVSNEPV